VTLRAAVSLRMRADVPLGAFLSGGIDSSVVVALMQTVATEPVRTFTIAFDHADFDESADARAVADHLGTQHHEWRVSEADALAAVPALPAMYDEPFADSSQIPTSVLAHLARQHVTVALSGDGGDELFGGYNRYVWAVRYWRRLEPIPVPLRRAAAGVLRAVPPAFWDGPFRLAGRAASGPTLRMPGVKMQKAARVLPARSLDRTYELLASITDDPSRLVLGATEPVTAHAALGTPAGGEAVERMMYRDSVTYLPDDILTKVDRATMAWSLEGRMPFLDPHVAALAWRLPVDLKVHGSTGKWLLRKLLHRYVPPGIVERPKTGFGIPLASWLRGDLRPWADDLLDTDTLRRQGLLDASYVGRLWSEHRSGRRDHQFVLWGLLTFQAWLDAHQAPRPVRAP
jgi:asparagine synthase (glutamine-hydrolysing)